MLLVYVDTGGMLKEVAALEAAGLLKTHYFPFEQRNRRVKTFVPAPRVRIPVASIEP